MNLIGFNRSSQRLIDVQFDGKVTALLNTRQIDWSDWIKILVCEHTYSGK